MVIWRNVIELRRQFRDVSPEVCLKALISTNGELPKAVALLGSRDFSFYAENKASLNNDVKACLNPSQISNKALEEQYRASQSMNTSTNKLVTQSGARNGRTMRAHRHLQETIRSSAAASLEQPYPEGIVDLRQLVLKCYYSDNYIRSSAVSKK